jgi:histidinol-phosphate aminotransferase
MSTSAPETETCIAAPEPSVLYAPPVAGPAIAVRLDANEGPGGCVDLGEIAGRLGPEAARRYPSAAGLERTLALRLGIDPSRILVTAGGDEAIDRVCRAFLGPGRELILPTPTFEMIHRYARLAGAEVVATHWQQGPYPLGAVRSLITSQTAMIAVVSPNNPTGAVATSEDLERLSAAAPDAVLLVDLAYTEFAGEDLTAAAIALPNAVIIRTFSKAFGLAGLRVGYAIGSPERIRAMRAAGSPYPVSGLSVAAAMAALDRADEHLPPVVARIREERDRLASLLEDLGAQPRPSHANFILADFANAEWTWRALAALGVGVRRFAPGAGLDDALRITCPGNEVDFARLSAALRAALKPQAILFDMDGVLADVSGSYRRAITLTAESFGVRIAPADIAAAKAAGDANNDWILTRNLLLSRGVSAPLEEVTRRFEALYHGSNGRNGLAATERLIPDRSLLERLAGRVTLGVVTGRPRRDCDAFLERTGLSGLFKTVVCMEDAPLKPDSAPVRRALEQLGLEDAWLVGDTPDDIVAARGAGVVPIGILAPGDSAGTGEDMTTALNCAGAARILGNLSDLEQLLP